MRADPVLQPLAPGGFGVSVVAGPQPRPQRSRPGGLAHPAGHGWESSPRRKRRRASRPPCGLGAAPRPAGVATVGRVHRTGGSPSRRGGPADTPPRLTAASGGGVVGALHGDAQNLEWACGFRRRTAGPARTGLPPVGGRPTPSGSRQLTAACAPSTISLHFILPQLTICRRRKTRRTCRADV